jgi:hypothetical protein
MSSLVLRTVTAVVLSGVVGTLANALARAIGGGMDKLNLALVPGRYAVAIAVCAVLPLLGRSLSRSRFWLAALPILVIVPSVLAKFVFAADAGWASVLFYNAIYAIAAIVTYVLIMEPRARR